MNSWYSWASSSSTEWKGWQTWWISQNWEDDQKYIGSILFLQMRCVNSTQLVNIHAQFFLVRGSSTYCSNSLCASSDKQSPLRSSRFARCLIIQSRYFVLIVSTSSLRQFLSHWTRKQIWIGGEGACGSRQGQAGGSSSKPQLGGQRQSTRHYG